MTTLQQKQLAFLEETARFYNLTNRCVDENGNCKYFVEGKAGCAIGRKVEDKDLCKHWDATVISCVDSDMVYLSLPDSLQELGKNFLANIQRLHDSESNWTETGLSESGQIQVKEIKEEINLA